MRGARQQSSQFSPARHDGLLFAAILTTLFSLAPGLAHVFELPRKMMLDRDAYFTVQQIYAGWALFGYVLAAQLICLIALAWLDRQHREVFRAAVTALILLLVAQAVFWAFTYPANSATQNWTAIPGDWEVLRRNWEYSHAAGALCQFIGLWRLIAVAVRP